jgi:hypothetical protein
MAEQQTAQPAKRWVILTFFQHAVERTEEQIAELKAGRLWVRDASGPGDTQQEPAAEPQPALVPETNPRPGAQPAAAAAAGKPAA